MIGADVLERFTAETFAGRVDETFRIVADETVLDARLISADEFRTRSGDAPSQPGKRTPFSLVFRAALEPVLHQRIYELRHDEMGSFELFLVPIGPDEHGMRYEAAFS
jgi:hypothetical protein